MIVFDIETGPLPDEQLRPLCPEFVPPQHPGEFDASAVKLGNLKDAAKITEKVDAARAAHQDLVSNFGRQVDEARAAQWQEFVSKAALSALTGRVLAIGYRSEKATVIAHVDSEAFAGSEAALIEQFWVRYRKAKQDRRHLVGHNIAGFDIPFLIRRSWLLGIDVPYGVFDSNWRYLDRVFIDTMARWQAGNYRDSVKLDTLGKALGLGGKTEGVDGADFARLYFGSQEERAKALEYLIRDVELTWQVAERLGIV